MQPANPKPPDKPEDIIETSTYKWREYTNKQFEENVSIYEKIDYWEKKNFFYLLGKVNRRMDKRFTAEKYRIKGCNDHP